MQLPPEIHHSRDTGYRLVCRDYGHFERVWGSLVPAIDPRRPIADL